jgi:hypothetical protein
LTATGSCNPHQTIPLLGVAHSSIKRQTLTEEISSSKGLANATWAACRLTIVVLNNNETKSDRVALQRSSLFSVANKLRWPLPGIRTTSGRVLELQDARGGLPPQYI